MVNSPLLRAAALPFLLALISCASGPERRADLELSDDDSTASTPPETPPSMSQRTLASEVILLTGLGDRAAALASMADIIDRNVRLSYSRAGISPLPDNVEEQLGDLQLAMRRSFSIAKVSDSVTESLSRRGDEQRLKALAGYFDSKAHRLVTASQKATRTAGGQKALGLFLSNLPQTPPDPERLARARVWVHKSGAIDEHFALAFGASQAIIARLAERSEGSLAKSLIASVPKEEFREKFRRDIERTLTFQMYFSSQRINDAYMIREVSFWNSPLGQWFRKTKNDVLDDAVKAGIDELSRELPPKPKRKKSNTAKAL